MIAKSITGGTPQTGGAETRDSATLFHSRVRRLLVTEVLQIDMRARTPSLSMSLPPPRCTIAPRSITRYWSASSAAKS